MITLTQNQYAVLQAIKDRPIHGGWADLSSWDEPGCSPQELDQLHEMDLLVNHPGERWRIDGCLIATAVTKPTAKGHHYLTNGSAKELGNDMISLEGASDDWSDKLGL